MVGRENSKWGMALIIALFGCIFLILFNTDELLKSTILYPFQTRDIQRAISLLSGEFIFWGPEASGGGNLSGPLYYLMISPVLMFFSEYRDMWLGVWWEMLFFFVVSITFMALFFKKFFKVVPAMVGVLLFSLSPLSHHFLKIYVNPSFLFIFSILGLIFLIRMQIEEKAEKQILYFYAFSLLMGFGIQIHFSIIFLFLSVLISQLLMKKLKLKALTGARILLGLLLFITPSLPFILLIVFSRNGWITIPYTPFSGGTEAGISSFIHMAKLGLETTFSIKVWIVLNFILTNIPFIILPLILSKRFRTFKGYQPGREVKAGYALAFTAALTFIPASYIFFSPMANRYGMSFYLALIFLSVIYFYQVQKEKRSLKIFNLSCFIILLIQLVVLVISKTALLKIEIISPYLLTLLLIFIGMRIFIWRNENRNLLLLALFFTTTLSFTQKIDYSSLYIATASKSKMFDRPGWKRAMGPRRPLEHWLFVWNTIYTQTGWSYDEARRKIYFVNSHANTDPRPGYELSVGEVGRIERVASAADGFLVLFNRPPWVKIEKWLNRQSIQSDLLKALNKGQIQLGEPRYKHNISVVPYTVVDTTLIPKSFHNNSIFYEDIKERLILDKIQGRKGYRQLEDGGYLFKWNFCKSLPSDCNAGIFVKWKDVEEGRILVNTRIVGKMLSQASSFIYPEWTQSWNRPFIEVTCGSNIFRKTLISSVGYKADYLKMTQTKFKVGNNSFLAPFEKIFYVKCRERISKVTVGQESIEQHRLVGSEIHEGIYQTIIL